MNDLLEVDYDQIKTIHDRLIPFQISPEDLDSLPTYLSLLTDLKDAEQMREEQLESQNQ